ncbi:nucleic acid-binding protein [Hymenopellis radicata]|nr:nucleic acid-binding protein [Hymenopellis radicata]
MSIAQLRKATQAHTDADWMLDETPVGQVTVVAQVVEIRRQATNTSYIIQDGAGPFEARHWNESNNEEDQERWGGIEEKTYIRVIGQLKSFNSKRYINAHNIRPITDFMEVYFHQLETITISMFMEHAPPPTGQEQVKVGGSSADAYKSPSASVNANSGKWAKLPPMQRQIIEQMLAQPATSEGINVGTIARAIGGDAKTISVALDALMDDGHIFSTIDDSHFKVSD